jgi:AraC-like DNA-binding protein
MLDWKIEKYGVFDSRKKLPDVKETPFREVETFEFEYLISCDKDAISFIDDKKQPLFPQMLIVRKPTQKSKSRLHFKCYCIHLSLPKTDEYYQKLCNLPNFYLAINAEVYREIFENFSHHIIPKEGELDDYCLSKLFELIYHLTKEAPFNSEEGVRKKNNPFVAKAAEYINERFSEKITLQGLGELTGYTPNHFQCIFTEIMGLSPQKFLENRRISQAKYLLAKGEKSIAEVAYECGFSSQAHLTSVFKKATLLTPAEYRNAALSSYPD